MALHVKLLLRLQRGRQERRGRQLTGTAVDTARTFIFESANSCRWNVRGDADNVSLDAATTSLCL